MKNTILLAVALFCTTAFASEEIYQKLAVEEQVQSSNRTEVVFQKSVGGLVCSKRDHVEEGSIYSCVLESRNFDEAAIYNALNVEEVLIESTRNLFIHEKNVTSFRCTKTQDVDLGDSYSCMFRL